MKTDSAPVKLIGLNTKEIEDFVASLGEKKFRGRQIAAWLYKKNASSIDEMSDLSAGFRSALAEKAVLKHIEIVNIIKAPDGTAKYLLQLDDEQRIEAVLLPYEDRISVCVSSQVGCAAGCIFCATGLGGFVRNMTAGEIVDEILTLQSESEKRISHVVYMGMGEPLLNYDNVIKSIQLLNEEVGIAMRHITISTVGITPRIDSLAEEKLQINLAISLHAPNDDLRRRLIPLAERYPLRELISACRRYTEITHRRVTFEYLLIKDLNDSLALANNLAKLLKGTLCNVNLIPYNAVEGLDLNRPPREHVKAFRAVLEEAGITVTQRMEKGQSVSAACGQLRRRSGEDE